MKTNEFQPNDEVVCGESSYKVVSVEGDYCLLSDAAYRPAGLERFAVEFKVHFTHIGYDAHLCPDCGDEQEFAGYCEYCDMTRQAHEALYPEDE